MGVFYRVRIKVSAPTLKVQWMEGLYVAHDVLETPAHVSAAKAFIIKRTKQSLEKAKIKDPMCDVVVFRRSDIGFILSPSKEDLENSK